METGELFRQALQYFDIFHVAVDDPEDSYRWHKHKIIKSFGRLLGRRFAVSTLDRLPQTILGCLEEAGVGRENGVRKGTCAAERNCAGEGTGVTEGNGAAATGCTITDGFATVGW